MPAPDPNPSDLTAHAPYGAKIARVYDELKRIAQVRLQNERSGHTLQATALVHEAFVKMQKEPAVRGMGRGELLAAGARAIREILIDHARTKKAKKRGGGQASVPMEQAEQFASDGQRQIDLIVLNDALTELAKHDPEGAQIVEMRFFGGLTLEEIAEAKGFSLRTANTRWKAAREWLKERLDDKSA